jgi:acetyltransferase
MADSVDEAVSMAEKIGFPVVVKADSTAVVHKSDMGGVAVNLENADAVRSAVQKMADTLSVDDLRFFVQKYLPGGTEIIMGAKAEEGLGHTLMFGLGGIFVEVLKDVVFNLTPVTDADAKEMLTNIKGAPLLDGIRGQKGVDRAAIEALICRLSQLLGDLPAIKEMDLNPVLAFEKGVYVVDARIAI